MTDSHSIQPVGFHVVLSGEWLVTAVSANIGEFLPCSAPEILGQPITAIFSEDAIHDMRNRMALLRDDGIEHLFQYPLNNKGQTFDLAIYRAGEGFGLDAERCEEHGFGDATGIVLGMLARVEATEDVESLCEQAARQLRALTGFERVVISGEGKLLGQSARSEGEAVDPAAMTSIEDAAIVDCEAIPVPVLSDGMIKLRSTLRAPTRAEIDNLAVLGARAALLLPLARRGQPWGHVGCYHRSPRHISAERRNIARLFARTIALMIELVELRGRA